MKLIYLYDVGIKPWEQIESLDNQKYVTLTLIQRSMVDLSCVWNSIVESNLPLFSVAIGWHTEGYARVFQSKIHEIKEKKLIRQKISDGYLINKNEKSNIISWVKKINLIDFDVEKMGSGRYSFIVLSSDKNYDPCDILTRCQVSDSCVSANSLEKVLKNQKKFIICRIHECVDTHAALQFIGDPELVDEVLSVLTKLKANCISSQDEVAYYINT